MTTTVKQIWGVRYK